MGSVEKYHLAPDRTLSPNRIACKSEQDPNLPSPHPANERPEAMSEAVNFFLSLIKHALGEWIIFYIISLNINLTFNNKIELL